MEQNIGAAGGGVAISTQSSSKGEGKKTGVRRGRGAANAGKGKNKIILTGHKAVKRGNRVDNEAMMGTKKVKKIGEGSFERLVFGDFISMEFSIVEGAHREGLEAAGQKEDHTNKDAEAEAQAGESQPRLEP